KKAIASKIAAAKMLGSLVFALILIPSGIAALEALDIEVISEPATAMLDQVLVALPNIFAAAILLAIAFLIAKLTSGFITSFLRGFGFDRIFEVLGLDNVASASSESDAQSDGVTNTPSELVGLFVLVGIMLFAVTEAANLLGFGVMNELVGELIVLASRVLFAAVIIGVGLFLAKIAFNMVQTSAGGNAALMAQIARIATIAFFTAIALRQLNIANAIVNLAFGLFLGAIAIAFAISFGIGGRAAASELMQEWVQSLKSDTGSTGSTSAAPPAGDLPPSGGSDGEGTGLF
ncbi:MAG: mechanosensitive ion channel, partial [Cyanobacteria bacterium J06639_1]